MLLGHALVSANQLVKQIGIGYSGNYLLVDPRPWEELPATGTLWEARGNKDYVFDDFARDNPRAVPAFSRFDLGRGCTG